MNKKQRNRKTVTQNCRNRIINKRYSSTTRSLSKLFITKIESLQNSDVSPETKKQVKNLLDRVYSIIDKAVKKGILHKNTAARKKSKFANLYKNI